MHVQIIIGSVRAIRIGDQIGAWVMNLLADLPGFTFELVDLRDWPLPMDAKPAQAWPWISSIRNSRVERENRFGRCLCVSKSPIQLGLSSGAEECTGSPLSRMGRQTRADRQLWGAGRGEGRRPAARGADWAAPAPYLCRCEPVSASGSTYSARSVDRSCNRFCRQGRYPACGGGGSDTTGTGGLSRFLPRGRRMRLRR